MKIAKYIGDLLYDYECVVIPGLGGFLTQDKPASIHPQTHHFRPPYKQIMFNAYLKTNDGLLVNYIAREENVSYKEAKAQVDKFVFLCDQALQQGKRIHFHKVGAIYLNKNQKIVFEQDKSVNYNADAFGLTEFVSPAIRHATPEEKLREQVSHPRQPAKKPHTKASPVHHSPKTATAKTHRKARLIATKKKSPYRTQLLFLTGLILAMLVGWGFMNKDRVTAYYENYSSVIPLFYSQPSAYMIDNIGHVPVTQITDSHWGSWWLKLLEGKHTSEAKEIPETTKAKKAETIHKTVPEKTKPVTTMSNKKPAELSSTAKIVPGKTTAKPISSVTTAKTKSHLKQKIQPSAPSVLQSKNTHRYYIIAGAFKSVHNVRSMIYTLKKKGYDALAVGVTPQGLHRVAYAAFSSRTQAEEQLAKIRQKDNPSAWILFN